VPCVTLSPAALEDEKGLLMRVFPNTLLHSMCLAAGLIIFALSPAASEDLSPSDGKLQAFVTAALKVGGLIDEWTPRIEQAATEEQKTKLKSEANAEMIEAIRSTDGITVEEYKQISHAAQSNPALQERIVGILQTAGHPPPPPK
jgi:Domain of unknown function (DUF4168)